MQHEGVVKGIVLAVLQKIPPLDLDDRGDGGGDDSAVVGLALRFALNARPTGSQGFAPGGQRPKTRTKDKNQKEDISNEVRNRTFLKSFDTAHYLVLTSSPANCYSPCVAQRGVAMKFNIVLR